MKRKFALLLMAVLCLNTTGLALAEETSYAVTLEYQLDGYVARTLSVSANTSMGRIESMAFAEGYSRTPEGFTFEAWYYDAALTDPVPRTLRINQDVTLYAAWTPWDDETRAMYDEYFAELALGLEICMAGSVYENDSFRHYYDIIYEVCVDDVKNAMTRSVTPELVAEMKAQREALVPTGWSAEEVIWYMWGDTIPTEAEAAGYDFTTAYDPIGFVPYMCAYLVKDQSQAKGNVFVCSGGANTKRNNNIEADPTAAFFQSIGYNAYVVNYRISPYVNVDGILDLQRAVRYLRYYAEDKGIGGMENLVAIGFSAGAGKVYNLAISYYGDTTPDSVYADYVCDAVDAMSADIDVCIPIYGAGSLPEDGNYNPNLPSFFLASGAADRAAMGAINAYQQLSELTNCELHIYAEVPHAYGMGYGYMGANQMGGQMEAFLDVEFGYSSRVLEW